MSATGMASGRMTLRIIQLKDYGKGWMGPAMEDIAIPTKNGQEPVALAHKSRVRLCPIVRTFFCIGVGSFSLAALGEAKDWLTKKRKWFTDDEYIQGLGLAQIMPGAPTVNLFSYLGFRLRGLSGAAAASISFLTPSFLLMLLLSYLYFHYGDMPAVLGLFHGLGALVVGLVFNTILNLWKSGVKTNFNRLMALSGFTLVFWFKMGIIKLLLIAGGASLGMVLANLRFPALRVIRRIAAFQPGKPLMIKQGRDLYSKN